MATITQYNLITTDGFIADKEGKESFFPDALWEHYLDLCEKFGNVIMGLSTYEILKSWNIVDTRFSNCIKIVVTTKDIPSQETIHVVHSPQDAVALVEKLGFEKGFLCSVQGLSSSFARANLLNDILLYIYPVVIGSGISVYQKGIHLPLICENVTYSDDLIKCSYRVAID